MTKAKQLINKFVKKIGYKSIHDTKSKILRSNFYQQDVVDFIKLYKKDIVSAFSAKSFTAKKVNQTTLNVISLLKETLGVF